MKAASLAYKYAEKYKNMNTDSADVKKSFAKVSLNWFPRLVLLII